MSLADEGAKLKVPEKLHTIRYEAASPQIPVADGITMSVEHSDPEGPPPDVTHNEDGSITVNSTPEIVKEKITKKNFYANLAESMDDVDLDSLASELLEAIAADMSSRKEWEETANRGIDLLGLKIEESSAVVTGGGGNISKAKDSVLLEAVLRYQSNFNAEMLPADGPVKIRDDKTQPVSILGAPAPGAGAPPGGNGGQPPAGGAPPPIPGIQGPPQAGAPPGMQPSPGAPPPSAPNPMLGHNGGPPMNGLSPQGPMGGSDMPMPQLSRSELANALQKDFNSYLTTVDKAYYADTDRMSFSQALFGLAFKKVYMDPVEKRPISRFVMANHLIVNNGASSLYDAKRTTHMIPSMTQVEMKRMMLAKAYREIDLSEPFNNAESTDAKIAEIQGTQPRDLRPEDRDYTVFECYCYLNLKGYEHKNELPLPYRVTIEKDSRVILEIRRNWKQGDPNFKQRRRFVKFPLFPGLGFYDYGFVHILGNTTRILSAIESLMVDGGMFSNFPGGMIDKMAARQETNQIRPGPGGFKPIDTGGRPIQQVVMPMPYKDVSPNLMQLATGMKGAAEKLASISELPLGEGRADVPVGTIIALIEQSTKLLSAVHKRNHAAQTEEFEILKELFMEDPEALSRLNPNPAHQWEEKEEIEDVQLSPASDPNVSSNIMRIMRAQAVVQMAQQAPPGLFDPRKVAMRALKALEIQDPEDLFLPPAPPNPAPNPHTLDAQAKMASIQSKAKSDQQNAQLKLQLQQIQSQDHALDRASQEKIEQGRLQIQAMKDAAEFQQGITPPNGLAPPVPLQ